MENPSFGEFTDATNVAEFRIARFSEHILFCGGPLNRDLNDQNKHSARDFLIDKISTSGHELCNRILFAEDVTDWYKEKHFIDLLSFERHISEIASLVFLVPESDGSYTELGAFANDNTINKKLFVLNNERNDQDTSFIALGPLALLRDISEDNITIYPWSKGRHPSELEDAWQLILGDLSEFETSLVKHPKFDACIDGHISLLIVDIIGLFGALKITECKSLLKKVISEDFDENIERHLFMLEKLCLIQRKSRGRSAYFVSLSDEKFIKYSYKKGTPTTIIDRSGFSFSAMLWFHKNDKNRSAVIKEVYGGNHE